MAKEKSHKFKLTSSTYSSDEIAKLVGRTKGRINQLAKEFDLGTKNFAGNLVYYQFSKTEVEWLLDWFSQNGQPRSDKGRRIRDDKFKGKDRYQK
jgi:hypothetical protein